MDRPLVTRVPPCVRRAVVESVSESRSQVRNGEQRKRVRAVGQGRQACRHPWSRGPLAFQALPPLGALYALSSPRHKPRFSLLPARVSPPPTSPHAAGGPWTSLFGVLATEAEVGEAQLVESSTLPTWRGAVFVLMWLRVYKQAPLLPALSREENLGSGAPSVPPAALGPRPCSCVAGAVSL